MPADPRTAGGAGGGGFGDLPPFTLVLMPRGELRALRPHDREEPVSQLALFGDVPAVAASARTEPAVNGDGSRRSKGRHASLTLGEAARIIREAVRDKSYRSTPVGLEVAHFIRWFRNEYGATVETLRDYEAILAKLAIDHADLELAAFEPPDGTTRLRVHGNPVVPIRSPRLRDVERELFSADDVVRIVAAQPELRDRVALKLLFLMGLRKGELAAIRYRDFDLGRRRLRVHGKGGKIRHTPIPTEELREEIAELSLRRDPTEHLLYPQKRGPKGTVIWENRRKPLSGPALHRWWYRCLTRAGVVDEGTTHGKKMHGARYTSGTEFYLATGDIYATQQLLGHADVSTTANIYVQGSPADLEAKLRKVWGE